MDESVARELSPGRDPEPSAVDPAQLVPELLAGSAMAAAVLLPIAFGLSEAGRQMSDYPFGPGNSGVSTSSILVATARGANVGAAALALLALVLLLLSPGDAYTRRGRAVLWSVFVGGLFLALAAGIAAIDAVFPDVLGAEAMLARSAGEGGFATVGAALPFAATAVLAGVVAWCASTIVLSLSGGTDSDGSPSSDDGLVPEPAVGAEDS